MKDEYQSRIIFREQQKFSPYITLPIVVAVALTVGISGFSLRELIYEQGVTSPIPVILLVLAGVIIPITITLLFLSLKLETEVRADGLYVSFFPLHINYKKFTGEDIDRYYPRRYRPILEYGGWGIRYGFKAGKAYNVKGNQALQLILKNGGKLLIGSQEPDRLAEALDSVLQRPDTDRETES